jgi:septum formation inhibitor MinC
MAKSITVTVDSLLQELRTTYTGAVATLDKERLDLQGESEEIQKAADELRLLLPAKARAAERAADDLLLKGKHEEAQAKRREQQQAEAAPAEMEQRRRAIADRIEAINSEKRDIARSVFREWFPGLRDPLVAEQRELCLALDNAWAGIQGFAQETGAHELQRPLVTANLRGDLTAREHGPEKTTFLRLLEWFGGRQ